MFKLRILYFFCIGSLVTFQAHSKQRALCDIWEEEIPVMAHLAVAMDGTVLLFREQREKKCIEVKRSKDGGVSWSEYKSVGNRIKIEDDMSDDGRYKGDHVGWTELANVTVDENTGDVMAFGAGLKPVEYL